MNSNCGMKARTAIIGQECICPDGLGRVVKIIPGICNTYKIQVDTYINNLGCKWEEHNVKLVPILGVSNDK